MARAAPASPAPARADRSTFTHAPSSPAGPRITANGGDDDAGANTSRGGGGRIAAVISDRWDVEPSQPILQARGGRNDSNTESHAILDAGAGTLFVQKPGEANGELVVSSFDDRHAGSLHLTRATPLSGILNFDSIAIVTAAPAISPIAPPPGAVIGTRIVNLSGAAGTATSVTVNGIAGGAIVMRRPNMSVRCNGTLRLLSVPLADAESPCDTAVSPPTGWRTTSSRNRLPSPPRPTARRLSSMPPSATAAIRRSCRSPSIRSRSTSISPPIRDQHRQRRHVLLVAVVGEVAGGEPDFEAKEVGSVHGRVFESQPPAVVNYAWLSSQKVVSFLTNSRRYIRPARKSSLIFDVGFMLR